MNQPDLPRLVGDLDGANAGWALAELASQRRADLAFLLEAIRQY